MRASCTSRSPRAATGPETRDLERRRSHPLRATWALCVSRPAERPPLRPRGLSRSLRDFGEMRPPQTFTEALPQRREEQVEIVAVQLVQAVRHHVLSVRLEDVRL